jgi:hypothetical protein
LRDRGGQLTHGRRGATLSKRSTIYRVRSNGGAATDVAAVVVPRVLD